MVTAVKFCEATVPICKLINLDIDNPNELSLAKKINTILMNNKALCPEGFFCPTGARTERGLSIYSFVQVFIKSFDAERDIPILEAWKQQGKISHFKQPHLSPMEMYWSVFLPIREDQPILSESTTCHEH